MSMTECLVLAAGLGVLWPLYEPLFDEIGKYIYDKCNKQR